jgi:hypothetical protein
MDMGNSGESSNGMDGGNAGEASSTRVTSYSPAQHVNRCTLIWEFSTYAIEEMEQQ